MKKSSCLRLIEKLLIFKKELVKLVMSSVLRYE